MALGPPQQPGVYNAGVGYPVNEIKDGNLTLVDIYGTGAYGVLTASRLNVPNVSLQPSMDQTGATDTANIASALALFGSIVLDTTVMPFYVGQSGSSAPGISVTNPGSWIAGKGGNPVYYLGNGPAVYMHGGTQPYLFNRLGFKLTDLAIDGTFAGNNGYGLDYGDGDDFRILDVRVANFLGANGVGALEINRAGYTEKSRIRLELFNNTVAMQFSDLAPAPGVTHSHWYSSHDLHLQCYAGQTGVQFISGSGIHNGQEFRIRGNFWTTTPLGGIGNPGIGVVLDFSASTGHIDATADVVISVELDGSGAWEWQTIKFGASGAMLQDQGHIIFADSGWINSDVAPGQLAFGGPIGGNDTTLAANNQPPTGWWIGQASNGYTPGNPGTITSTTNQMLGLAKQYTPTGSGRVLVILSGVAFTASTIVPFTLGARYGTGSTPNYQAADTGTRWGANTDQSMRAGGAANGNGFCFVGLLTVTPGVQIWIDLAGSTSNIADALTVQSIGFVAIELEG